MAPGIVTQCVDHTGYVGIGDVQPIARGHVMIGYSKCKRRLSHTCAAGLQFSKRMVGAFVHQMPVNP